MANQEQFTSAEGWEFRLVNDHLVITSQSDPATQVQLNPRATFALQSYLSKHRDALYAAQQGQQEEPEYDWREPSPNEEESAL